MKTTFGGKRQSIERASDTGVELVVRAAGVG